MEQILKKVLNNGVVVILKKTERFSPYGGIIAINLFIKGGIVDEEISGLTNLTVYLLTKGSKNFSKYEIAETFEEYGGFISTKTSEEYSTISILTKIEGLEKGLKVLKDILFNPLFKKEELEKEKENVIAYLHSEKENPFSFAFNELKKITYTNTPYENRVVGSEESLMKISVENLFKRWEELKEGKRMVISVVGDFEKEEEILKNIENLFAELPAGKFEKFPSYEKPIKETLCKEIKRKGAQATILCAFNAPKIKSEEFFSMKVLNAILGNGFTSLLFRELREKRGYAYATTSFYPTQINLPRLFTYIGTSPEKHKNALEDMIKVVKEFPITERDLELAKRKLIGNYLMAHQTRLKQSWYLGFYETMNLGYQTDIEYTQRIEKVRYDEILKLREKYLTDFFHCVDVN
jgi:predicted Zn-dependent peptidase